MTSDVCTDVTQLPTALTMDDLAGFAGPPKSPPHRASQNPDITSLSGALPVPQLFIFLISQPIGDQAEGHAGARPDTVGQKSEIGSALWTVCEPYGLSFRGVSRSGLPVRLTD